MLEEVDGSKELELLVKDKVYSSNLFPAPQYSRAFPGQVNQQSVGGAKVDVTSKVLPHQPETLVFIGKGSEAAYILHRIQLRSR